VADLLAVKSGFTSGYGGEGPHTFSYILQVLRAHCSNIDEYNVSEDLIERLDSSALTQLDIVTLDEARPIRPTRWYDYVLKDDLEITGDGRLFREFRPILPYAIIDGRIVDLALSFWDGPDDKLLTGYRRLEDIVRERTGINEHGAKLFSQAFLGPAAKLSWENLNSGEINGRGSLFASTYNAYRNPRAHRELESHSIELLTEFLLLNHLLEKESVINVGE